jgi:potassium-dependent mechanosensitive channel
MAFEDEWMTGKFWPLTWNLRLLAALGLLVAALAANPCALAQAANSVPRSGPAAATPAPTAPDSKAAPTDSRVNTAEIVTRLNQELGLDIESTMAGWQRDLDGVERELGEPRLRYSELNRLRDELDRVRSGVADAADRLAPRLDADKAQLKLMGAPPPAGQPQEPEQVTLGRATLNYHFELLSAGEATVSAANLRIDSLLNGIQDIRRKNFASILFAPIPGVYAYDTWAKLPQYVPLAATRVHDLIADWWRDVQDRGEIVQIAVEATVLGLLLAIAGWRGVRRLRRSSEAGEPPFWRRASSAAGVVLLRALPVVAPVVFLYAMVADAQPLPESVDWVFYLSAQYIVIVATVVALVTAAFAPGAPQWRLIPATDAAAARVCGLVTLLATVYSVTSLLYVITRLVQAPFALTIAVALPSSLLISGVVVALLRTPLRGEGDAAAPPLRVFQIARTAAWALVAAIAVCALAGYLALARFLAQQLVVTGSILALVYLMLLWVDGFAQGLSDDGSVVGRRLKQKAGLERARREQLALPISLFLKFALLVLAVPLIMLQWGYSWPDIREWYRQLFFGLHVGNTEVTFGALLAALIVFGLGYGAARLFQGWLDAQVLQPAGISGGVRNSIRTGVGYVGIMIAALAAFSYAGFNLSNLAIVAGALSVGIGFGLQNLVNNFVSGLILLAERPIRVGDMVVVGGEEGYVRKISVRSTELETFDRAHVIIPNSYFIAEKVKNWTFRNNIRRIALPVGVAYGSDARQVQALLLKIARDNGQVLTAPAPFVTLDEFAAASLNFTLYAFVGDITKATEVRTELAFATLEALAAAGIEIPFGQTDIAIRKMDWLREMLAELAPAPNSGDVAVNGGRASPQAPVMVR